MDPGVRLELTTSRVWTSPATIANTLEYIRTISIVLSNNGLSLLVDLSLYAVVSLQQQR